MSTPERLILDRLATPDGALYRIHTWQNGRLIATAVVPRDLACARLTDLGYTPDAAEAMIDQAQAPA